MGCTLSRTQDENGTEPHQLQVADIFVFVPGLRIPKRIGAAKFLEGRNSGTLSERLKMRTRILFLLIKFVFPKEKERRNFTDHGGPSLTELRLALEEYLSILQEFLREGFHLSDIAEFSWSNQEDEIKETTLRSAHYELLSVLHLLGMLFLIEANIALTPKPSADGSQSKIFEESKKAAIELLLKAAQVLECCLSSVLPQFPAELKAKLPVDLQEAVLRALQLQALGQGVEIQLGLAIDNVKATLAVKRRLACEGVKYWNQTQESMSKVRLGSDWGKKHALFVNWKCTEAKAAAYYYHGLILDEGLEENTRAEAVACLREADVLLKESQKNGLQFCAAPPMTRLPIVWGPMVHLSEKIPKDFSSKVRVNRDAYCRERTI
ncbi:hypothetical protein O6H91_22G014000 [Diphasiastrum complanatum]|uniref:Uncharacterized protein n=1 Tax=Diphasiastrum complanatum TaxID=34168 RepID=A0ACC2AED9_DIPCM|nr:hypothetical protein O6H91_22G014000 [Diphasiastrum complanatum]